MKLLAGIRLRRLAMHAMVAILSVQLPLAGLALANTIDLANTVAHWPADFDLRGSKTEPTWVEYVRVVRHGNLFVLEGGGLHGAEQTVEAVRVSSDGRIVHVACPPIMDCSTGAPLSGFLAIAELVGLVRRGELSGSVATIPFGDRLVFCLPAERLGVVEPILDPCFDVATGAVVAQRARTDQSFSGPTLDVATLRFVDPPEAPPATALPVSLNLKGLP